VKAAAVALLAAAVLAGCGEGEEAASSGHGETTVAALGDSITAGSPQWDPDPAARSGIADPNARSQYEYWAEQREPSLAFRNCGVFGERTDEIHARLDDCAEDADVLVIQGGINDIAQGRSIEAVAGSIQAMVDRCQALGIRVVLVDVLPWNNGQPRADRPIETLNGAIRQIGRHEDVDVVPFHDALEDPEAPGTMRTGWTIDGDHPSVEGYRILGELLAGHLAGGGRS